MSRISSNKYCPNNITYVLTRSSPRKITKSTHVKFNKQKITNNLKEKFSDTKCLTYGLGYV